MITGPSSRWGPVGATALALAAAACGTGQSQEEPDEMVGEPPSEQTDPFRVVRNLERADTASTSGVIGADDDRRTGRAERSRSPEREASRVEEAEPSEEGTEPDQGHRCFSCVRICPLDEEGCAPAGRDVICGWGVHADRSTAGRAARAECRGALDLARQSGRWSRIEGTCPDPTCS